MHLLLCAASVGATLLAIEQAAAACATTPVRYHFQNETVTSGAVVDAGSSCMHRRGAGGRARFTSFSVTEPPQNGSLSQAGQFTVVYRPRAGFRGQDSYAVRICGTSSGRAGCSTIRYQTTVR